MAKRGNNEGTIYKRQSGTWRAQVSINNQRLSYTGKTRVECHQWLRKTMDLVDRGMNFENKDISLEQYLEEWFEIKKNTIKPKTAYDYRLLIDKYILPDLGKVKIAKLTTFEITHFYVRMKDSGKGTRTIQITHNILRSVLQDAVRNGLINRNPCDGALLPRNEKKEMNVLNEHQVTKFLIAAEGSRYKALYHLAITTGMRYSELVGLKWGDIDWEKGTIKVQRQLQYIPHKGYQFSDPKTRSGVRTIMLGNSTLEILREHYRNNSGSDKTGEHLIFVNAIGTKIYFKRLHQDFKRVLREAGLPEIRFHDLRHTAATLMISNGIPVVVVSKILGHSKPSVTMNIYAHTSIEMQSEAAKLMENLVTPIAVNIQDFQNTEIQK